MSKFHVLVNGLPLCEAPLKYREDSTGCSHLSRFAASQEVKRIKKKFPTRHTHARYVQGPCKHEEGGEAV